MEVMDYKKEKTEQPVIEKSSMKVKDMLFYFGIVNLVLWVIGIWQEWWFKWFFYTFFLVFSVLRWQGK